MCDVLQLQPAGAFLRQAYNLQPLRLPSNPIAVVGSCTDIDEALRLEDNQDAAGYYYQASKENTYYSPDQKLPGGFLLDDALDLSDTSTASSSLVPWAQQESDDESDMEELIFQLDM
ncbi:hypothetical protein AM587_10016320 [Phytophthora nicotianae]|uniref:Uncharacterized protein n=1 Tax=Phytophthora nicotianae TaxID=4792 RepID=A0A0W8D2U8_PHYNI|nr:hypothetical protein AM587_10016320 [Phytophthora nicotianae]